MVQFSTSLAILAGTAVLIAGVIRARRFRSPRLPRGFRKAKTSVSDPPPRSSQVPVNRDRFSSSKIPRDLDCIVVGSGIGGLTCAAVLSKVGLKVLVLEQHYVAGGFTHAFEDQGFEFETGIHYIGQSISSGRTMLDLAVSKKVEWAPMAGPGQTFDRFLFGEKEFCLRVGVENFRADLKARFPSEAAAIDAYLSLLRRSSIHSAVYLMTKLLRPWWLRAVVSPVVRWLTGLRGALQKTVYQTLRELTSNEELIAVLCGQCGDYGLPPSEASFFIHELVAHHYLNGGYFPVGGTSTIAEAIIPSVEKAGGRVLVGKRVSRILVQGCGRGRRVWGVEMEDGTQIPAPTVVSDVGVINTYCRLLNPDMDVRPFFPLDRFLQDAQPSYSSVIVFVGLRGTAQELGLERCNVWVQQDPVVVFGDTDPLSTPPAVFISSGSAKDPQWPERHPDRSTVVLVTLAKMEWFRQWERLPQGHRGEDYTALKDRFAEAMLEQGLFRAYPSCRGCVEYVQVGTPCSVQHFSGYRDGEIYGLRCDPKRFAWEVTPETFLPGLYLTGQDVLTAGFMGALAAGVLTAC
eukprot:RCo039947